jgi:hypothetical protein
MNKILLVLCFLTAVTVGLVLFPSGATAVLFGTICAALALWSIERLLAAELGKSEKLLLRGIFLAGLLLRVWLAVATNVFRLVDFFGGDSTIYDRAGYVLMQTWFGYEVTDKAMKDYVSVSTASAWGMYYFVGGIYSILGRNPLAVQFLNCVLGALTAVLIYFCAQELFRNRRVALWAAALTAFFPSLIIWSSQGLKDCPIVFLLVLAMLAVLRLQERFSYGWITVLIAASVGIFSLRFYIFFAFATAAVGSFILGSQISLRSFVQRLMVIVLFGLALTSLGILQGAQKQVEVFGSLETLQNSRLDQAVSAESGYGRDLDVSTPLGALQALPIGFVYFMFAPFPWEVKNFRQAVTLPEVLLWWATIPLLVSGLIYAVRTRLQATSGILLFTILLTLAYSIFQGNVGTAYRQRSQMQVFYFIFVAAGIVLLWEKRENRALLQQMENRRLRARQMHVAALRAEEREKI